MLLFFIFADIKTVSSNSSRSHPYSSDSEDESAELCPEVHSGNSAGGSSRSSSSQDLHESDDQGKYHAPVEESLETEIEEQEITKVEEVHGPPLTEVSCLPATEEEPVEETEEITEPKTSGQSAFPEAKVRSQLQEGGTSVVEDRKAGLPGLEEGKYIQWGDATLTHGQWGATLTHVPVHGSWFVSMRLPELGNQSGWFWKDSIFPFLLVTEFHMYFQLAVFLLLHFKNDLIILT